MKIREFDDFAVIDLAQGYITEQDIIEMGTYYNKKYPNKRIAINTSNVSNFSLDFMEFLSLCARKNKISLFSLNNDIFLQLFISGINNCVDIYLDEQDFIEEKRLLVKRNLKLVKVA